MHFENIILYITINSLIKLIKQIAFGCKLPKKT
jgi:hypothetical protein